MAKKSVRIIQLTDSHLFQDREALFFNINVYATLNAVVAELQAEFSRKKPELIVFSGDISQDQSKNSYQQVLELLKDMPCPVGWIGGNHDNTNLMRELLIKAPFTTQKSFSLQNWQIILLNSCWDGHVEGLLSDVELEFLTTELKKHSKKHIVIFLHHQFFPIDSAWLDRLGLDNRKEFLKLIKKYSNIRAVICGHVHQENFLTEDNITFISTPSTSFQFSHGRQDFAIDKLMPGYRWFDLFEDGNFDTDVIRLPEQQQFIPVQNISKY